MKVTLPTSWKEVTLNQFIELSKVKALGFDDLDATCRILEILTGISEEEFLNVSISDVKKMFDTVRFLDDRSFDAPTEFKYKIKGQRFKFEWDASQLLAGEYIDMQNYIDGGVSENMHNIMAIYLKPVNRWGFKTKGNYKKNKEGKYIQTLDSRRSSAEMFKDNLTMDVVFSCNGFFLNRWQKLIKATHQYLGVSSRKAIKNLEKAMKKEGLKMPTVGN